MRVEVLVGRKRVLINNPGRCDAVTTIGVDEHVLRDTRRGGTYVTMFINLTGPPTGDGPARLLDMVAVRCKDVFKTWLSERSRAQRDGIEVVATDGLTGFRTRPRRLR